MTESTGVKPQVLKESLEEWNRFSEQGKDPSFSRKQGVKPLKGSKYYAYKNKAFNFAFLGGLRINTNCQVVDKENKAIEGLYAAGLAYKSVEVPLVFALK